jgi:hypothetical protein
MFKRARRQELICISLPLQKASLSLLYGGWLPLTTLPSFRPYPSPLAAGSADTTGGESHKEKEINAD